MPFRVDASTTFASLPRTTQGGLIIPAALTRTGVFTYYRTDGTKVRELRHPDEVFKPESLATLKAATVTVGHPTEGVNPTNWKQRAVGHVDDSGKADGDFVASDVRVLDASALAGIENKSLQELSCGYGCKLDMTPGTYNGEAYDGRQVDIVYNHVALLPKGAGRAGPDVRLRLDASGNCLGTLEAPEQDHMTPEQIAALQKDLADQKARADAAEAKLADKSAQEASAAKEELLKASAKDLQAKLDAATDPKAIDAKVQARVSLVTTARNVLDSKDAPYVAEGKSDHQVRVEVLARLSPAFKVDGKSEAAVEGAFSLALELNESARAAMSKLQGSTPAGSAAFGRKDGVDTVQAAYLRNIQDNAKAHEKGSPSRISA